MTSSSDPNRTNSPNTDRPWESGPPLLSVLRERDGNPEFQLPDEPPHEPNRLRFSSGSLEGIALHWPEPAAPDEQSEARAVYTVLDALKELVRAGDDRARAGLYRLLLDEATVPYVDTLVDELVKQEEMGPEELRPHARWLVRHAAHRGPLKLGIVLLGLCGTEEDLDDLKAVARHDEFTPYAAVAAANLLEDPVDVWWEMARNVHGWGKIHVIERLCQRVAYRADVQDWLLRHGCENHIMPGYLACGCATAGGLAGALAGDAVDDELLDGACTIVRALLCGGPAEDIEGYPDGVRAVQHLLRHLAARCGGMARLHTVWFIHEWLEWPEPRAMADPQKWMFDDHAESVDEGVAEAWRRREALGWSPAVREQLAAACAAILSRPEWPDRVWSAYGSEDGLQRHRAWVLSGAVGVDLWEEAFARLARDPLDSGLYSNLLQTDDPGRIARVIAFAEERLPLEEIAAGPADVLGLGPEYRPHDCLVMVVQEMRRPGVFSDRLLATALRSPVVNNRNMAINALETHTSSEWGPAIRRALSQALHDEPREDVRERLGDLAGMADDDAQGRPVG
jgi:hypothetical protein